MHRWSSTQKRLMLAAMLVPWVLLPVGCVALGVVFAQGEPGWAFTIGAVCFAGALLTSVGCGMTCLADRDRRVTERSARIGWTVALFFASAVAAPVYWWLHVRMGDGEPHGLRTLRPAAAWSRRLKVLTGLGALFTIVFLVFWVFFATSVALDTDDPAVVVPVFIVFGVWAVVAPWVVTLLLLAALRGRLTTPAGGGP